jgi:uroporphyrin-III C-methyltransferase/precorrin-2 dehydrogenase/sirohydrochlorin ferrochelatase
MTALPIFPSHHPRPVGANPGRISLVGAGPGARDLLTLRALARLEEADVIFYDRLVDPEILNLARKGAERVYVGKAVGACAWPQERIDAVIVAAARRGRRVVRLKSGDPCMFGRATEELAAARAAGIEVEIVPGVTAASAAGAALGRSLTERGATDRVVFATGTCRAGDAAPDWGAMLTPGTTLALYMGVAKLAEIRANLLAAGVPATAEVEIVCNASSAQQHLWRGTLAGVTRAAQVVNPAIILVRRPKAGAVASPGLTAQVASIGA